MANTFELGLDTFGDVTLQEDGTPQPQARVLRDVIAEAVLADELGLDAFGVGEHHRGDFAVSAPEVILAAIAGRTKRIRLGSAVTVLSTDDPVRVFQRFSTLNAISNGRAEVILGRGSFTESYPLFGYDLARYEELFEDKLSLFAEGFNIFNRANVIAVNNTQYAFSNPTTGTITGPRITKTTNFQTPRSFFSGSPSFSLNNSSYNREFQLGIRCDF